MPLSCAEANGSHFPPTPISPDSRTHKPTNLSQSTLAEQQALGRGQRAQEITHFSLAEVLVPDPLELKHQGDSTPMAQTYPRTQIQAKPPIGIGSLKNKKGPALSPKTKAPKSFFPKVQETQPRIRCQTRNTPRCPSTPERRRAEAVRVLNGKHRAEP